MTIYDINLDQLVKDLNKVRQQIEDGNERGIILLEHIIVDVSMLAPETPPPPENEKMRKLQ
jgi:hypothetical protein